MRKLMAMRLASCRTVVRGEKSVDFTGLRKYNRKKGWESRKE
jgi:hypothetical protein